jgi:nitrile hydratase
MDATRRGFLKTAVTAAGAVAVPPVLAAAQASDANMQADDPGHAHDHDSSEHDHKHQTVPSEPALRVKSLESLLVEKGLVQPAALDALIQTYEEKIGPRDGARVVARAWVDPMYKKRLLEDADKAIGELGYGGEQGEHMVAVENTPRVHNVIVCTLCSCYPWAVLGLPPTWYKSAPYRSRMVMDPRGVLHEFGLDLPEDVEVRVWDSTAELRYLVLPERPQGTGKMKEAELAELVTRDSMIGVGKVTATKPAPNEDEQQNGDEEK